MNSQTTQAQADTTRSTRSALILPLALRSIETDWSFGLAGSFTFRLSKADTAARTSNLQALALYSVRRQFISVLNGATYFPGERYILNHQLSYSYFPDKFWGLGKLTPDSNEENYIFRQYYIYLHLQRRLVGKLFAGLLYEYQRLLKIDYLAGGLFDRQDVTGRYSYAVSGLGASLTYDTRNNAFASDRGTLMQISFNNFLPALGSDFRYTNVVLDLRKFIPLHRRQVLALQAYGYFTAGEVPLRSLASLGGATNMRGYYDGRYRDKNQLVFQSEYRVPLFWRLGAVVFANAGNVAGRLDELNLHNVKYSYGGGLRFALNKTERLNIRVDYGIGQGTSRGFYFQLGEAF
ncbi:BamA/TamA family outer membrane protein [Nibrella saemangeumensis]|uniref:BamA/TamA family outer membrane protein n=1 Tax=Nibrella saemangeumensis TaxID=1084526 RepID=UPI0031EB537E